jgi:hypothetical protein
MSGEGCGGRTRSCGGKGAGCARAVCNLGSFARGMLSQGHALPQATPSGDYNPKVYQY